MNTFLILALPRSRSAWLCNLLTFGPSFCLHEPLVGGCCNLADLRTKLARCGTAYAGASDTLFALLTEEALAEFPEAKIIVLLRDRDRYVEQARAQGLEDDEIESITELFCSACDLVRDRALFVRSRDLDRLETVVGIWRHIGIDAPFPERRYEMLRDLRVEVIAERHAERMAVHESQIAQLMSGGN